MSLYCPLCMDESEVPPNGIQGLPRNMYVQNLQELQSEQLPPPKCDLCTDNEIAMSHCEVCLCYLCEFCEQAHRRQRRTAEHPLIPIETTSTFLHSVPFDHSHSQPEICHAHPNEEVVLFCETCDVPICHECTMEDHCDHAILPLDDVNMQYSEILQKLLSQTKPLVTTLNEAMKNIEFLLSSVRERAEVVANDICDSVDLRMRALQEHKRSLLSQLDAIKQHKENTLELQLEGLKDILDEVNVNSSLAVRALREGDAVSVFTVKAPIVASLEELVHMKHNYYPQEDDYIQFYPNLPARQCRGLEMFGVLSARSPSAAHSVVEGEGLFEARQRKMAMFTVTVHDRYGQRRLAGRDKVEACMHNRIGEVVNATVTDNDDGTYQVSYTPESVGEHRLSVLIDGKHVRASPFVVNVRPKQKKHRGVFQCCTFCSSGGRKHVRCGCGGTMPGGYSGCGHGHPGHPGCWHWSCCGNTVEVSECLL